MGDSRFGEFFDDDATRLRSMNRLATFIAIVSLVAVFFCIMLMCIPAKETDLRELLGALTTLAIIIAGLGGFNYAAGRAAGAYTEVKVAQAEKGIQPPPPLPPPLGPTTVMNIGQNPPAESEKTSKE